MSGISGNSKKIRKYLPAAFLVVFTIALMFYFKENRGDFGELVDKGKDVVHALMGGNPLIGNGEASVAHRHATSSGGHLSGSPGVHPRSCRS